MLIAFKRTVSFPLPFLTRWSLSPESARHLSSSNTSPLPLPHPPRSLVAGIPKPSCFLFCSNVSLPLGFPVSTPTWPDVSARALVCAVVFQPLLEWMFFFLSFPCKPAAVFRATPSRPNSSLFPICANPILYYAG